MPSEVCQRAIDAAVDNRSAILKFISPNDAGLTKSHQYGFLLPHDAWELFTPDAPVKGENKDHPVRVLWHDGRVTDSMVKWYGAAKSEYRLTRFGEHFPHRTPDAVGNLLVLVPRSLSDFEAYVLSAEKDIDEVIVALNVSFVRGCGVYDPSQPPLDPADPLDLRFRRFVEGLSAFPTGDQFTAYTRESLLACRPRFSSWTADRKVLHGWRAEFALFKMVESHLVLPAVRGPFDSIEAYLVPAKSVTGRRATRAGRSLENHVDLALWDAGILHEMSRRVKGMADCTVPTVEAFKNSSFPEDRLFGIAMKTTLKERWKQVVYESPRVRRKYLLTLQDGMPAQTLREMREADVTLIVPEELHSEYPMPERDALLSVEALFAVLRSAALAP